METYVVRIWEPAPEEPDTASGLRGEVLNARTGQRRLFTSLEDLAGALRPPEDG